MATTTKTKPAVKRTKVLHDISRGGRRDKAGRKAEDGATNVVTVSIGLTKEQLQFLDAQGVSRAAYLRKLVQTIIDRRNRAAA